MEKANMCCFSILSVDLPCYCRPRDHFPIVNCRYKSRSYTDSAEPPGGSDRPSFHRRLDRGWYRSSSHRRSRRILPRTPPASCAILHAFLRDSRGRCSIQKIPNVSRLAEVRRRKDLAHRQIRRNQTVVRQAQERYSHKVLEMEHRSLRMMGQGQERSWKGLVRSWE